MPTLHQRLRALEARAVEPPSRMIVISANASMTEAETAAFLAEHGVSLSRSDVLVRLVTFYEMEGGGMAPPAPPKLLAVTPTKR